MSQTPLKTVDVKTPVAPVVHAAPPRDANTVAAETCPANWDLKPIEDSDDIEATNRATARRFVGSREDFNAILKG